MGAILDRLNGLLPWVRAQKQRNLAEAAAYLEAEWKKTVGVQGTRSRPSAPGSPPHRVTGALQASLSAKVTDGLITVTGSKVGGYLEDGTRRMAARPHRGPTLDRCRPRMLEILAKKKG